MKREVIERLYEVFAHYKDDLRLAQNCGVTARVSSLTPADFRKLTTAYDFAVLLCNATILRHFLPRIIELDYYYYTPNAEDWTWFNVEFILGSLRWHEWPKEEVEALRAVWKDWTPTIIKEGKMAEFAVYFLAEIGENLDEYLDIWLRERPVEVAKFLYTQVDWTDREIPCIQWAMSLHVGAHLEAIFYQNPSSENGEILSNTVQLLQNLREFKSKQWGCHSPSPTRVSLPVK